MKKLFYLLLLLPLLTINSCKKDTGDDGGDGNELNSIAITVLEDNKIVGIESFVFRVRGDDNITYTSQCDIFIDGQEIGNNYYTPTHGGTMDVYAVKGNLTSPTITVTATEIDIEVSSDRETTYIEMEPYEFTVTGSNGNNYTSISTFYVNGTEITGRVFDPEVAGDYEVYAVIGDGAIISPTITLTATVGYEELFVDCVSGVLVSKDITFSSVDNLGRNLTGVSTFFVNGTEITGNTYTVTAAGNYEVTARYDAIDSGVKEFDAASPSHTTKVLVEDYTGAWCQYCPRLWWKLEDAVAQNTNIIVTAIHDDTPMKYEFADAMESEFDVSGFPTGKYNRINTWDESESQLNNAQAESVGLGLGINSTRTGDNLDVTVKVGFDISYSDELKLVLYVVENGLLYDQVNYYDTDPSAPTYQMGNPIPDFEHNNVVRKAFTDVFGDVIPSAETVLGGIYSRTFNVAIPIGTGPSDVHNADNIHLVAFVIDGATKEVINVQKAEINEDKDFD
jgi:sRNA-binding regulator protein Hfq